MVSDVIEVSRAALDASGAQGADDIRSLGRQVIRFSDGMWGEIQEIRAFLFERMYRAPDVKRMRADVTRVVEDLFPLFMADPTQLPSDWRADVLAAEDEAALARIVADYIAGMTDRFALDTHQRLIG